MAARYTLVIGNRNYSSWSLRAWLLMKLSGADFDLAQATIYRPDSRDRIRELGGETGLVPLLIADGQPTWDTLAIAETLAEHHPKIWPGDPRDRARARSYCGEVHGGLNAIRAAMPTNVRGRRRAWVATPETAAEIARVTEIWSRAGCGEGPWLFGEFCGADALFAPVACRFRTYDVTLEGAAGRYQDALLAHPLVEDWSAASAREPETIAQFELPTRDETVAERREVWI